MNAHATVVAIVGPTAVGKTALSLALGEALGGEIVNADSRQVYRGMDVGTGKPSMAERARVPHHLFDIVEPNEDFSLALYLDQARAAIADIHARNRSAILVGGTGQYVWALLEGWQVPRVPPDPAFRQELAHRAEEEGAAALHAELTAADPEAAKLIDPNNVRRTIRALEVIHATGRRFSAVRQVLPPPWDIRIIGLTRDREALYERINQRVDAQVAAGWPDEARALLAKGYDAGLPSFGSLGYREMASYVRSEISLEETAERIKLLTRRLARRQYAWFRLDDARIEWLDAEAADLVSQAMALQTAP